MSEWAIRTLRRVASDLRVFEDGRRISEDILDAFVTCLELVYRDLIAQEHVNGLDTNGRQACELVRRSLTHLRALQLNYQTMIMHLQYGIRGTLVVPDLKFLASNWSF